MKGSLRNRIYTKIYSRWIKDFNVRPEIIQLLEKNISRTIFEINCSNNFWGLSPKAKEYFWSKNKQMQLHQTEKHLHSKGHYQQNEKTTYWMGEGIWKSYIWYGVNIQNILQPHTTQQQKNNPIKKLSVLNRYFSKEDIQMANWHMKRCLTSLIIREMQIKTIMRYHLTPVRMAIMKKSTNSMEVP